MPKPIEAEGAGKELSSYSFKVAEAWAKKLDDAFMTTLTAPRTPVKPPTRWQVIKRNIRRPYQYLGQRLTRWLMNKFDIYEGDW